MIVMYIHAHHSQASIAHFVPTPHLGVVVTVQVSALSSSQLVFDKGRNAALTLSLIVTSWMLVRTAATATTVAAQHSKTTADDERDHQYKPVRAWQEGVKTIDVSKDRCCVGMKKKRSCDRL